MKRSIVQHGPSSLIVSLPSEWVKRNKLKKGDQVEVTDAKNILHISTKPISRHLAIPIDITGLDRTSILSYIQSLYKQGYDEIMISFKHPHVVHFRKGTEVLVLEVIQDALNRFIGFEIIRQGEDFIHIKQISEDAEKDLDTLLRRIIYLTTDAFRVLEREIKQQELKSKAVEYHRKTITKFTNYCIRLVNKGTALELSASTMLVHLLEVIDKIMELVVKVEREKFEQHIVIPKNRFSIIKKLIESMELFQSFYFSQDLSLICAIEKNRDDIKRELTLIREEPHVASLLEFLRQIPELIQDLIECSIKSEPVPRDAL